MHSRWDALLDKKPVALKEQLLEEVAKVVSGDLARWPLPIEGLDEASGKKFAPLFARGAPRPGPAVLSEAFRLARWELGREWEAIDDYHRNRRWAERGLAPSDSLAIDLYARWLVEQMLSMAEATGGRVRRADGMECLERIRRRAGAASSTPEPDPGRG